MLSGFELYPRSVPLVKQKQQMTWPAADTDRLQLIATTRESILKCDRLFYLNHFLLVCLTYVLSSNSSTLLCFFFFYSTKKNENPFSYLAYTEREQRTPNQFF